MNLLNSNRLIKTGSVLLLLVGSIYFSLQFLKQSEIEHCFSNEFVMNSSAKAVAWTGMEGANQNRKKQINDLPSFKNKSLSKFDDIANSEVDFQSSSGLQDVEPSNETITVTKREVKEKSNSTSYSYNQQKVEIIYSPISQHVSDNPVSFQTENSVHANTTAVQFTDMYDNKTQTLSNVSSNSFLAINTLSLSVNLSDNNSPMMIDGGSNPGDPGVPVGDGLLPLLLFAFMFGLKRFVGNLQLLNTNKL